MNDGCDGWIFLNFSSQILIFFFKTYTRRKGKMEEENVDVIFGLGCQIWCCTKGVLDFCGGDAVDLGMNTNLGFQRGSKKEKI